MYDVVIVGRGPAGLSAAIYACRAGKKTVVIGNTLGALEKADKVENYFGFTDPISGRELLEAGDAQARRLGAVMVDAEVTDVRPNYEDASGGFAVFCAKGEYRAKNVLLATGAPRKKLTLPSASEFEGKGISFCAVCDAFFYRGKKVGVIGGGEYALHELGELLPLVGEAVVLLDGKEQTAKFPDGIEVISTPIECFYGGERLEGVKLADGRKVELSGVFVAIGTAGALELAVKLGLETKNNAIVVDEKMRTNLPGVFAAGDCTGGTKQVVEAVAQGAKAALAIIK